MGSEEQGTTAHLRMRRTYDIRAQRGQSRMLHQRVMCAGWPQEGEQLLHSARSTLHHRARVTLVPIFDQGTRSVSLRGHAPSWARVPSLGTFISSYLMGDF